MAWGTPSAKQYVKNKPYPWGIKIFMMCGWSGLEYDFLIYQGSTTELSKEMQKLYGFVPTVVEKLCECIKDEMGHKVCYFSSYHLLQALFQLYVSAGSTIRINRFAKPPFIFDKEALKKERGSSFEKYSLDNIILVESINNKTVTMDSNFLGIGEIDQVQRWEERKKYVAVQRS